MKSVTREGLPRAMRELLKFVDTPMSRTVLEVCERHPLDLKQIEYRPSQYAPTVEGVRAGARDYLAYSYVRKYKGLNTGESPALKQKRLRQAALDSFTESEMRNRLTNARFRHDLPRLTPRVRHTLLCAQQKVESWLGHAPVLAKMFRASKWSGGATATLKRGACVDQKQANLSVSTSALAYARAVIQGDIHWLRALGFPQDVGPLSLLYSEFQIQECEVFDTVPKDIWTDRTIGKQATLNGFLQQGVHSFLRTVLSDVGLDLSDQTINQKLAEDAWSLGLATVDLRNASNSLSKGVVSFLLPPDWYRFLDAIRHRRTLIGDEERELEMFSAMGNAFTFELETLIFYALSLAVREQSGQKGKVSVYGDDIIVPAGCRELFLEVFSFAGFEVNESKSFWTGPFFESCGKHYLHGVDITPIYQKEVIESPESYIRAYNRIMRYCLRAYGEKGSEVAQTIAGSLMRGFPLRGALPQIPYFSEGDDGFLVDKSSLTIKNGEYMCRVLRKEPVLYPGEPRALLAYKLRYPFFSNACPRGWDDVLGREGYPHASIRKIAAWTLRPDCESGWLLTD
jgi:hypothetical protein